MAEEMDDLERIYVIPIKKNVLHVPKNRRTKTAMRFIKSYISRHMKTTSDMVWIDMAVNRAVWARGIRHPPNSIKVKAVKFEEDNLVEVTLPEE